MSCRFREAALTAIVAHARADAPRECCGVLLGAGGEIAEAVRARNLAADPDRFLIDPKQHIDARREGRRRGLDVVGFYHSHPRSPALPSATDLADASYADHLYVIVSLTAEPVDVRVFILTGGNFRPVSFVTLS